MHREPKIQADDSGRPDTIVARFIARASSDPVRIAFFIYPMGALQSLSRMSWGDWIAGSRSACGALLSLHAAKAERVAIFADNHALWPIAALGVMMCGLVPVAIHPQAKPDQLVAQLSECGAKIVIVDTVARFKLLRSVLSLLPGHVTIICDDLEPLRTNAAEGVYEWESWCKAGAKALDEYEPMRAVLAERIDGVMPSDRAFMTFGGGEQAMVLTHENLLASAALIVSTFGLTYVDRVSSYKPLSDPFEIQLAICGAILSGYTTALLEHSSDAFIAARQFEASIFSGASRAFDRLKDAFENARTNGSYLRDTACEMLGRHCRLALLDGDVLPEHLHRDLRSGGVALATVYGTAQQNCICVNGPQKFEDNSIGVPFPGIEAHVSEHGELQVRRSALSFAGNRADGESVNAPTDDAAWLHTGDRVEQTASGAFRLIGHTRDLLQFADGRSVAPQSIEDELARLPFVQYAVCHADGNNSIVAVLSLKRSAVEAWALTKGIAMPWEALVALSLVHDELARGVAEINARHNFTERVVAFAPTDLEFTVENGELNERGQIVRSVVVSRFRHVFADLHNNRHA
ncbi:MAG: AMP-binding protein [Gemmatimonadaceae bacterium]